MMRARDFIHKDQKEATQLGMARSENMSHRRHHDIQFSKVDGGASRKNIFFPPPYLKLMILMFEISCIRVEPAATDISSCPCPLFFSSFAT